MKNHFTRLFAFFLLLPLTAHASIRFTVTNVQNSSHANHNVTTPMWIYDESNRDTVFQSGFFTGKKGLPSGQSKSITWTSGYLFRRHISGYYTFNASCQLDGHTSSPIKIFSLIFIPDNTDVDLKIECTVTGDNTFKEPIANVTLHKQSK